MWQFTFIFALFYANVVVAEFTTEECSELGFIKGKLMCSSCEKLDSFVQYNKVDKESHCKDCCLPDIVPATDRRYPKATLEVCTCKFRAFPQIQAFIKSDRPSKFPNLQIKFVRGLDPIVKLQDKAGNVKETLSISKWNTDAVEEFFETHLEKVSGNGNNIIDQEKDDFLKTNEI